MPGGRKNKTEVVLKRRKDVAELYLKGWFQHDIAAKYGLSKGQISQDLKAIYKEWKSSTLRDFDELKEAELARINRLEQEYWEAWEKSKLAQLKERKKYKDAKLEEMNKETTEASGDPRYLQGIQWCINKRSEILGLNAPEKHEHALIPPITGVRIQLDGTDKQSPAEAD